MTPSARIFISYSHRGRGPEWKAALLRALHVFERQHLLDVWEDGKIRVSSYWEDDIERAMAGAQLAVILLTPDALKSEFILDKELPRLAERQKHDNLPVFPVICEECDWRRFEFLQATQAPNNSNPLATLTSEAQDSVFRQLATVIAEKLGVVALAQLPSSVGHVADDHIYLERFPLTCGPGLREEKLIGREQELALLDLAFAQPHTAIVSLVAWGGVGKTMLVQHWLRRLQCEGWFGARRVYAWSFFSQGTKEDRQASEDMFLAHALEWFGVQCEPTLSPWDKGRLLADAVACERTLLILDGIEPLQYPPGPMGGQLRAPGVQSLLKQLARKAAASNNSQPSDNNNSLCLVTTREPLTDLADFLRREGSAWGGVLRVDLGNLTDETGAALLHHAGANRAGAAEIKPDDKELLTANREVDGHALTLNLLGRFLARAHGGDIRRRDLVKFEEADRKEQGGTTFKMLAAFENWFAKSGEFGARQLAILRMLGLFDRPADAGCIGALRKTPVIEELTDPLFTTKLDASTGHATVQPLVEEDWNTATSFLADFGLLVVQTDTDNNERLLDCHPLIREHFGEQFRMANIDEWDSAHQRLYQHLCESTGHRPLTMERIQPLYQAVRHGCHAYLHEDALTSVYYDRILHGNEFYTIKRFGSFAEDLSAISCFFAIPWTTLAFYLPSDQKARLINLAAFCLRASGRLTESLECGRLGLAIEEEQENYKQAAEAANNVSELELTLGNIEASIEVAKRSVDLADKSWDRVMRQATLSTLANAELQAGRISESSGHFHQAESHLEWGDELGPFFGSRLLYSLSGYQYCDLLLRAPERAAWAKMLDPDATNAVSEMGDYCRNIVLRATQTLDLANTHSFSPLSKALDHITIGRAALYVALLKCSVLQEPKPEIDLAVEGLRNSGQQIMIPHSLLIRALLRCSNGNREGAQADLDEAWDIASRGPMRLHMADIHLYRARLFFREKTYQWKSPQDDLAAAEKIINDCGYHRRDEELADAKRAILGV